MSAVLDLEYHIRKIFKGNAERYAKKLVELRHCKNFNRETIRENLKSVTSYSKLVPKSSSPIFENERFVKHEVNMEGDNAGESVLYRKWWLRF